MKRFLKIVIFCIVCSVVVVAPIVMIGVANNHVVSIKSYIEKWSR